MKIWKILSRSTFSWRAVPSAQDMVSWYTPTQRSTSVATTPHPDYSSPESEAAIRAALSLVLELREDGTGPLARKVALYERTLGLAVVPVLVRRALRNGWRRLWRLRQRTR